MVPPSHLQRPPLFQEPPEVSVRLLLATADDVDALVAMNGLVQDLHADLSPQIFRRDWDRAELAQFWRAKLSEESGRVLIARAGA